MYAHVYLLQVDTTSAYAKLAALPLRYGSQFSEHLVPGDGFLRLTRTISWASHVYMLESFVVPKAETKNDNGRATDWKLDNDNWKLDMYTISSLQSFFQTKSWRIYSKISITLYSLKDSL